MAKQKMKIEVSVYDRYEDKVVKVKYCHSITAAIRLTDALLTHFYSYVNEVNEEKWIRYSIDLIIVDEKDNEYIWTIVEDIIPDDNVYKFYKDVFITLMNMLEYYELNNCGLRL